MKIFDLFGSIHVDTEQAEKSLAKTESGFEKVGNKVAKVGGNVSKVGQKLSAAVTAPIMGIGTAAVAGALNFEDAMAKVSTIADTTEVPLEDLKKSILDLSNETGIASSEIADNVYNAISAGQSTGDAVNFVQNATRLATAGFAESADTLDVLSTILNAYGLEATEVGNVSDMLIQTQNKGKTTVSELASSMGKVIPTANAYGVSLDQLCTSYAIMTANGIATAETTTYLNSMINELGKSGTSASKVIEEKTGKSFGELISEGKSLGDVLGIMQEYADETGASMGDLWGSAEAGKAALVLLKDGADGFNSSLKDMNNAAKDGATTQESFEKMETTSFELKKALNELKNTAIDLGGSILKNLMPYIEKGAEKVKEFSEWFAGLDDKQKDMIVKIGLIVAAVGPVLSIVGKTITVGGKLISGAGKVTKAIGGISKAASLLKTGVSILPYLFNPVTLAIGLVVAAGVVLYKNWDSIKEAAGLLKERIGEHWDNIKEKTSETFDKVKEKMSDFADETQVNERFGAIKQAYEDNGGGILGVVAAYQETQRQAWIAGYDALNALTGGKLDEIKFKIEEKIGAARDFVKGAIDNIKGFFNFEWNLPHIKLPHFSMLGSFSLNPPSVPKLDVDWYAKAMNAPMIMNKPTAFGVNKDGQVMAGGETGSEVVSGTDTLMGMIKEATAGNGSQEIYKAVVEAMIYVFQNYGLQLILEMDADSDALFRKITVKNNEFKKMHGGKSALA
mgnify:CR=1 FL=1|nr:MAG TPA: minor tail protein [Caudoviricetes sp.]